MQRNLIAGVLRQAGGLLIVCVAFAAPTFAVEVPTLYTAEVPLDDAAKDPRAAAYEAALVEILMRVSDEALASDPDAVAELFPNPAAYVLRFRPGSADTLWVTFDGAAIERTLRSSGRTVWGGDRPLTLVWLAVDWGGGEREIIGADDAARPQDQLRSIDRNRLLRERVLEVAARRGLPLVFPLLDTVDLQSVTFSDIWGGFDERVLDASRRYDASSILIGRVRASGQRDRWTYYFGDQMREFGGTPEAVVGQVAGLLAAEFAVGGNAPLESVALSVSGIESVDDYGRLQQILGSMAVIERFSIAEVTGDRISYRIDVRGGPERLGRALRFNGLIEEERVDVAGAPDTLEYYFGR